MADRNHILRRLDAETYEVATTEGQILKRFTTSRDLATQPDAVDLLGLDHPLVQEQLDRWRQLPAEEVGLAVLTPGDESAVLTWWLIEASAGSGERRRLIQPIALSLEGRRLLALERTGQHLFSEPPAHPVLTEQQRIDLFTQAEQTLQRELQHQGLASGQDKRPFAQLTQRRKVPQLGCTMDSKQTERTTSTPLGMLTRGFAFHCSLNPG